ncbi:hypothetical protein SUGI_0040990 [Cryptomeria japonica]|nr:hypothetical protein SUGI_0040990 [Cryptomeria japonica]
MGGSGVDQGRQLSPKNCLTKWDQNIVEQVFCLMCEKRMEEENYLLCSLSFSKISFTGIISALQVQRKEQVISKRLQKSPTHLSFLIVVDDIDHVEQLNAVLIMDIVNKLDNRLVIVTNRDGGVLIAAGITHGYHLKVMDRDHVRELSCRHAFDQPNPSSGYEELSKTFVDVCGGLPLSLQVLGRHVHGRSEEYWSHQCIAERVWEGSEWNVQHALKTLRNRCLVEETNISSHNMRMDDHLRDLGREMVLELKPSSSPLASSSSGIFGINGFQKFLPKPIFLAMARASGLLCCRTNEEHSFVGSSSKFVVLQNQTWTIRNAVEESHTDGAVRLPRAVDGVESTLNGYLFYDSDIGADAVTNIVTEIGTENNDNLEKWRVLGTVIVCSVVVIDSSTLV